MPRFSILLPTHNRADIIGFAIRSVLAQTERDFELLVVGDGCSDHTADVVSSFRDQRIKWLDLRKAPFSGYANRNVALRKAEGDLIIYAQDDDLMLSDHLALIDKLMQPEIAWAYTRPLWVTTDGIIVPYGTNLLIPDEMKFFLEVGNTIPSCCVVHRRDCFQRSGYWPEDMPRTADYEFWKKIIRDFGCERVGYLPLPTTLHFSADWKNSRHSAVGEVLSWLSTIDQSTWWPSVFRHDVGMPPQPQAAIFTAMEHDGDEFVDSIRQATIAVMDRQAWQAIRHIVPSLSAARTRLVELERQLETMNSGILQKDQDAAKLRSQLEAIFASSSWRVTAPLRMARRLFQRLRR